MSWYAIAAVDRALSRTKKALFEPFDFWKWAKLAIIIFLIGGGGSNFGGQGTSYQGGPELATGGSGANGICHPYRGW